MFTFPQKCSRQAATNWQRTSQSQTNSSDSFWLLATLAQNINSKSDSWPRVSYYLYMLVLSPQPPIQRPDDAG